MRIQRRTRSRGCGLLLAAALAPAAYSAENTGPEPAVVTSSAAQSAPAAPAAPAAPMAATAARPAAAAPVARPAAAAVAGALGRAQDRIELETTQISGNRELPKVMYVVPWRKPDLGDFSGRPPNSLLDEALAPLDRDVFRRQNRYYASLATQAAAPGSQAGASVAPAVPPLAKDEK
jgi:hypothetical protein